MGITASSCLPRASLVRVGEGVDGLRQMDTAGEQRRVYRWGECAPGFTWVNEICYDWIEDGHTKSRRVPVALGHETWVDAQGPTHETDWAWVSGRPRTAENIVPRCNRAGRHRGAIEATFLVETRHGDHFEPAFSDHGTALQGWHDLMTRAPLLNVLTFWTDVGRTLLDTRGYTFHGRQSMI